MATDVSKAKAFCGKMFDSKLEDTDMGDMTYTMIKVGEGTGGGLMKNPMPNATSMSRPRRRASAMSDIRPPRSKVAGHDDSAAGVYSRRRIQC